MNRIVSCLLGVFLSFSVATMTFGSEPPPRLTKADTIDAEKELERIGSIVGTWEGVLDVFHDPVASRRSGGPLELRIKLDDENAAIQLKDREGTDVLDKESTVKGGEATGTVLAFYAGGSETFAEYWVFVLHHVDRDLIKAHVMRAVHNANTKPDNAWRSFSMFGEAKLNRVKK